MEDVDDEKPQTPVPYSKKITQKMDVIIEEPLKEKDDYEADSLESSSSLGKLDIGGSIEN